MNALARTWSIWIARGIASVVFGIVTLVRPGASLAALVLVFGVYALADGVILIGVGFRSAERRGALVLRGLLGVAAGLVTLFHPSVTATTLYVLIGVWAITCGGVEIAIAAALRGASKVGGLVLAGVLSLACGVALLALPAAGMLALLGLLGAYAIVNGIVFIAVGLRIHKLFGAGAAA